MLATREAFATRCLPLTTANSHGLELLCPAGLGAICSGGADRIHLVILPHADAGWTPASVFGHGILTLPPMHLMRTEPGTNLCVQGPVNLPRHGIQVLTGVIETDWLPFSFTMNWQLTERGCVTFHRSEPFCHFFTVTKPHVEAVEPEIRPLDEVPKLAVKHRQFTEAQLAFNQALQTAGSKAQQEKWRKQYCRGLLPDGRPGQAAHQVKHRPRPSDDRSRNRRAEPTLDHKAIVPDRQCGPLPRPPYRAQQAPYRPQIAHGGPNWPVSTSMLVSAR